jgi:hypothetical protein
MDEGSSVLEVGCGTGQATRSLAALGCSVTAVEPAAGMAAVAGERLAAYGKSRSRSRPSRSGRTSVDGSIFLWPRRLGIWSTRRSVGVEPIGCSVPEDGWRCSATSWSAGRASRSGTPTSTTSTSVSHPATRLGSSAARETRCEQQTRAGDWSMALAACSARRRCGGIRQFSDTRHSSPEYVSPTAAEAAGRLPPRLAEASGGRRGLVPESERGPTSGDGAAYVAPAMPQGGMVAFEKSMAPIRSAASRCIVGVTWL